jgi:hypothetical protein
MSMVLMVIYSRFYVVFSYAGRLRWCLVLFLHQNTLMLIGTQNFTGEFSPLDRFASFASLCCKRRDEKCGKIESWWPKTLT